MDMPYFVLFYDTVERFTERRMPFRSGHLRRVQEAYDRGALLLAGALADPADRALLIFRVPDRSTVEGFAQDDPYVVNGLVTRWSVRAWNQVIETTPGEDALVRRR
jgi:uncharacterized protein YciI